MKKYLVIFILSFMVSSCIPTKDLTYFQGKNESNKELFAYQNKPYRLQVNDIIDIQIKASDMELVSLFNKQDLNSINNITKEKLYFDSYSVDTNGMIRIPYLKDLNVLGYTTKEVRKKIETELGKMFKNSEDIFVTVKLAGIRYTVMGEVKAPGTNILYQNQVTILEALANAGDINMTGDRKKVVIVRNSIDGVKKFELNLTSLGFMNKESYYIQPNDIIYVRPLKEKSWGTGDTGAKSFTTIVAALSLVTTTILLIKNI